MSQLRWMAVLAAGAVSMTALATAWGGAAAALCVTAILAAALSSCTGYGGAALLLPVLVWALGAKEAVPALTIVQLVGNGARAFAFRKGVKATKLIGWYALGAIPGAIIGAALLALTPAGVLNRALGAALLGMVACRWTAGRARSEYFRIAPAGFAVVGAVCSICSAIVGTAGPLATPFFMSQGLTKERLIGTEAATSLMVHTVKILVFGFMAIQLSSSAATSPLSARALVAGLCLAPCMVLGTLLGKKGLEMMSEKRFNRLVEFALIAGGVKFLIAG